MVLVLKCAPMSIKTLFECITSQPCVCVFHSIIVRNFSSIDDTVHKAPTIKGAGSTPTIAVAPILGGFYFLSFLHLKVVPGYGFLHVRHASIRYLYSVPVYYFGQRMSGWKVFVNELKEILSNVGLNIFGERGVKPGDFSSSVFLLIFVLSRRVEL